MYCINCGEGVVESANFCAACGEKVRRPAVWPTSVVPVQEGVRFTNENRDAKDQTPAKSDDPQVRQAHKRLFQLGTAVAALLVVAGGMVMLTDEADIQTPASFTSSADRQIHTNPVTETLLLDEEAVITDSWEVPTPLNDLSI